MIGVPLQVGHPVHAARDHAEPVVPEAHHGQVALERATRGQDRRVHDLSDGDVHLPHRDALNRLERAGSDHVEDAERRQVDHRRALAHREMLGVDDRGPPPRVPFRLAARDSVAELVEQRRVRLVPVRPLPTRDLEEDGAELALASVERR